MKLKVALISAVVLAGAIFGITHAKADAAQPGKVGNAPRCEVTTGKEIGKSFDIKNNVAKVEFKVKGPKNCRVQLTANSFYAPNWNGKPWNQQILYKRVSHTFNDPGTYTMKVDVPAKSNPKKGCFYQIDLTYGVENVLPLIAWAHGKIKDCGQKPPEQPKPEASCQNLNVTKLSRTNFQFTATGATKNGAKINGYVFNVRKNGTVIAAKTVQTTANTANYVYAQTQPGTYTVQATVKTSEGEKNATACNKQFEVTPPTPGKIEVCELATKKVVTIDENQMSDKYTKDLAKCIPTPEKPDTPEKPQTPQTPQAPKALPNTGAGAVVAIFTGVTSLSSAAYYFISRRFL